MTEEQRARMHERLRAAKEECERRTPDYGDWGAGLEMAKTNPSRFADGAGFPDGAMVMVTPQSVTCTCNIGDGRCAHELAVLIIAVMASTMQAEARAAQENAAQMRRAMDVLRLTENL